MSLCSGEVPVPHPQKELLTVRDQPFNPTQLGRFETAAARQPYRNEPELCPVGLALGVNMRSLVTVCRMEEER
jgi:hypothetical protein